MKQPEMVMLSKCRFLLNQALDADQKGDVKNALVLYKEAISATELAVSKSHLLLGPIDRLEWLGRTQNRFNFQGYGNWRF